MTRDHFFFRIDGALKRVDCRDILFLQTADNYTNIYLKGGFYTTRIPLKLAVEQLKDHGMVQIHRSYAVIASKINVIAKDSIVLIADKEVQLPFNRKYLPELLKRIDILGLQTDAEEEV